MPRTQKMKEVYVCIHVTGEKWIRQRTLFPGFCVLGSLIVPIQNTSKFWNSIAISISWFWVPSLAMSDHCAMLDCQHPFALERQLGCKSQHEALSHLRQVPALESKITVMPGTAGHRTTDIAGTIRLAGLCNQYLL